MKGRRVLVTRAPHQAGSLNAALTARGAEPVACPVLRIDTVPADVPDLGAFDWLVLTSPNAVRHLAGALSDDSLGVPRIAVVGPGTAATAREYGWRVDLLPDTATGEGLAAAFVGVGVTDGTRVLRVRGDLAPTTVEDTLIALGADVAIVTLYRTVSVPPPPEAVAAVAEGRADAVTFASGSAVTAFLKAFPDVDLLAACLGPVTAAAARQAGWRRLATAAEPTSEALVEALERAWDRIR